MKNNVLDQYTNIKASGISNFPLQDTTLGTHKVEIVGVDMPEEKAQRYLDQKHYQWVIKCKCIDEDHGNQEYRHWITFSAENDEKAQKSTSYFSFLARQLQELTGATVSDEELNAKEALDAINSLKGKQVRLTQKHDGKKYIITYTKA